VLTRILLADLLRGMKDDASPPEPDFRGKRLHIETPAGTWVFTARPGRRAECYLQVTPCRLARHKLYPASLPFDDLLTLAHLADVVTAARRTARDDIRHIGRLTAALDRLDEHLNGGSQ